MELFHKLKVSILPQIQTEVLDFFNKNPELIREDVEGEYFVQMNFDNFPLLKSFIVPRTRTEIVETSTCFLSSKHSLRRHIDGLKKDNGKVPEGCLIANQWVLIIPIANTEQSISYWYDSTEVKDEDEQIVNRVRPEYPYNFYVSFVKDDIKLEPIGSTIIDAMTFIKSDTYHTVENHGPNTRLFFIIRFREDDVWETPSNIFQYEDLT
jgi:hypothetical protein